ncbi:nonsense-mediated mRNA decay factor SMG9-like isoform X2 [Uloborus diversus]|uniref:nonsense-mediated mRNA decay factor SMG9-like isoform X2 n=1 Tax=Uloborus diversus TaxID=327109 RepID=UPI00240A2A36|nr:nonsense-mediated mRNA decay factor SMG9-like isoform X2 [Uloborus diversus]
MPPPNKNKESTMDTDTGVGKTLVILAKPPDKTKSNQSGNTLATTSSVQNELLKSPTIVQKVSSSTEDESATASANKETESFSDLVKNVAQRVFHVQQKPSIGQTDGDQKLLSPPEMSFPVKLVDESLQWCDNALEYLHDATDFYVIGVLGLQGVGKSTILSLIKGNNPDSSRLLFKPQTNDLKEIGEHCTTGIDMYVTNQRLILLDTQPVMSSSVMDHMIQYEKKPPGGPDYHSVENALLMQSLQQAAFLMAVCHTIISVQDWFIDLNYLRFLLSAEMLKPTTPINIHDPNPIPEETSEYYPHIVFVQNCCHREDFYPDSIAKMQDSLHLTLQKSKLKYSGSVNCGSYSRLPKESMQKVNLFLLPEKENQEFDSPTDQFPEYKGHPSFRYLAESLSHQVLSMPRSLLTHTALSEKNCII